MFLSRRCISVQNRVAYPWETEREVSASSVYSVLKSLSQHQGQPEPSAAVGCVRHTVQRANTFRGPARETPPELGGLVDAPTGGQAIYFLPAILLSVQSLSSNVQWKQLFFFNFSPPKHILE